MCWYAHREGFVPFEIMVEKMIQLTFNSKNMYKIINYNNDNMRIYL